MVLRATDIVAPTDCALLIGIPLDRAHFDRSCSLLGSYAWEFCARTGLLSHDQKWRSYDEQVGAVLRDTAHHVSTMGVSVTAAATTSDLGTALRQHRVVTLFTHHDETSSRVEFATGLCDIATVLTEAPEFDGVVELALCKSDGMAVSFKAQFPCATIIANLENTYPRFRALLYRKAIQLLRAYPGGYARAVADLRKAIQGV